MSKNLKKDYLKKLATVKTSNGYKIDLANYVCNPSMDHLYPDLTKVVDETDEKRTYSRVYYFKYYDGSGEYIRETYEVPAKSDSTWVFVKQKQSETIETSNRFSLNRLITLAEAI